MYGDGKIIRKKCLAQQRKRGFFRFEYMFFGFPLKFFRFWVKPADTGEKNTERTIADPPRYLLNLNLNYEKLRHKNRQKTLFRNIRDPYFCIFQHKNLLSVIIEGNPGLEVGGVSDNLNNLPVAETVMLDPLSCTELQNRGRDEL